jgi:radical SAM superfamily enzyme YgiQ (UPF0313 family)
MMELPSTKAGVRPTSVLLVGFQDQDNLGLRYLMSAVEAAGHTADLITYQSDPEPILARIEQTTPDVVGFSLIFQYMAPDFGSVIAALRDRGVAQHITMGGHYSSFEYDKILEFIPGLDSVVRFEGEQTLVNLLECLGNGADWRNVNGIAFRSDGGEIVATRIADPLEDLDSLAWPDRRSIDYEQHTLPTASILGSRGCPWTCSFCSIRPFYEAQGGPLRRFRSARSVVDEMMELYYNRRVPVFLFQDDDFLAGGKRARRWASEIADLIVKEGLAGKIAFKISCRSDEISEEILDRLLPAGLTHVYMGVESGDEQGLLNLNKRLKPETHVRAGQILKRRGVSFDFGFMLLDPDSTFDIVRTNIDFLDGFIGDGWAVAPFCRMLPYAGTPARTKLEAEGRLLGNPFQPDYQFLDPRLDVFYDWVIRTFYVRNFTSEGLCHILRGLLFEAHMNLPGRNPVTDAQRAHLHFLTAVTNRVASYTLRSALDRLEATPISKVDSVLDYLQGLTVHEQREEARLTSELNEYYTWVHPDATPSPEPPAGGFDKSWTLSPTDPFQPSSST